MIERQEVLVDLVMDQIREDVEVGDLTAIQELLLNVNEADLIGFLSEERLYQLAEIV